MNVQLNGTVVNDQDAWIYDFFDMPCFSPQTIRAAVEAAEAAEDEEIVFEVNSDGGSVFAGFEMYSVLRNCKKKTVAEIQSLAASSASVLMLGCSEVRASPVAQVMIHLPSAVTDGDRYAHVESIGILDGITESILNAYSIKSAGKTSRDELKRLMKNATWMTAPQAKNLGLIDSIIGEEEIDPASVLNCARGTAQGVRTLLKNTGNDRESLIARYDALVAEGKAPARGAKNEKEPEQTKPEDTALRLARAKLALEKERFGTEEHEND